MYEALRSGQYLLAASPGVLSPSAITGFDHVEVVTKARPTGTITVIRPDAYMPGRTAKPLASGLPRSAAPMRAGAGARVASQATAY